MTTLTNPAAWHRRLCPVTDQLVLSGDLPQHSAHALFQLDRWQLAGITHILDYRDEWSDAHLVAAHASAIDYCWLGTNDDGLGQDSAWFDTGVAYALDALDDPRNRLLVHCHMGINRGPSMGFAILLALGWDPTAALDTIRAARPIAAVLYAHDALAAHHQRVDTPTRRRRCEHLAIDTWFADNDIDVASVIRAIRRSEPD